MKKLIYIFFVILAYSATSSAQIVVIAHKNVPVDTIKRTEILNFYVLDIKSWKDGTSVVVFDLKPKDRAKKVFYDYLGKSTSRMKSIWMKKLLSGEGNPPEALNTEEEMLKKVAATPGAIGFVSNLKVNDKVKILLAIEE